jgi:hypothetical protein
MKKVEMKGGAGREVGQGYTALRTPNSHTKPREGSIW